MNKNQYLTQLKSLNKIDPTKFNDLIKNIMLHFQQQKNDQKKLSQALSTFTQHVMSAKNINKYQIPLLQNLINTVIQIILSKSFKVGLDAFKFIFIVSAEFYKTPQNYELPISLYLGRYYQSDNFQPKVGENCDICSYIVGEKYYAWRRCNLVSSAAQTCSIKYQNLSQFPQAKKKQQLIFAQYTTRTPDNQWRLNLNISDVIDCHFNKIWYQSTVIETTSQNTTYKKIRVSYKKFDESGNFIDDFGNRFKGLISKQDQWLDVFSPRIQPHRKMTNNQSQKYFLLPPQDNTIDDLLDILFQEDYLKKQFYAAARPSICKSTSLLTFINTFVENKGIHKIIQLMDNPQINEQTVLIMIGNISSMTPFFPKMFMKNPILSQFHTKICEYLKSSIKSLNSTKIELALLCYDNLGKRIYSIPQSQQQVNQLKKLFIKQFLKMNLQKQILGLRYLNQLLSPKITYDDNYKYQLNQFLKQQQIYQLIYQSNTHQQIISRTSNLLQYLVQNSIISQKQFENIWLIIPLNDLRGRVTIEKLFIQCSKKLPISYIELLTEKILSLQVTQLTINNLNLLKQLSSRNPTTESTIKIISFLWDTLTIKSGNITNIIEDEVQKVYKSFISTIKNLKIKMLVLQIMSEKLFEFKKIKNYIILLKDFIKSYPSQIPPTQIMDQNLQNTPKTIHQAVTFIKTKQMYKCMLTLLFKSKQQSIKKDILSFLTFLFQYDSDDINNIIRQVYCQVKLSTNFLQWIHKLLPRSLYFCIELLEQTKQFSVCQNFTGVHFKSIKSIIADINVLKKNIKIKTKYQTRNAYMNHMAMNHHLMFFEEMTHQDFQFDDYQMRGVVQFQKKCAYLLVPPSKIIGMKFVWNLLPFIKQKSVYSSILQLIVQFVSNLDESIADKTQQYRKQFLTQLIKQIKQLAQQNKYNQIIKQKFQIYFKLILQIFQQTQKSGLGNLQPHFQKIQGQKFYLRIQNTMDDNNYKFNINCNQNYTFWRLKKLAAEVIGQKPQNIHITSHIPHLPHMGPSPFQHVNGKSISHFVHQKQNLKLVPKISNTILLSTILNEDNANLLPEVQTILTQIYNHYKNPSTNKLQKDQIATMSTAQWKNQFLKQKGGLQKIWQQYDLNGKGYLTNQQFNCIFYDNATEVVKMINLCRQKKTSKWYKLLKQQQFPVNESALPRKILSNPQVFHLLFSILSNETYQQLHLTFYKFLSQLQQDQTIVNEVQSKIYQIITNQKSICKLSYTLEVANSQLSKRSKFFLSFWQNNGLILIIKKIKQIYQNDTSFYSLHPLMKSSIIPGFIKIFNMYITSIKWQSQIVQFINQNIFSYMDAQDFMRKYDQQKQLKDNSSSKQKYCQLLLQQTNISSVLQQIYHINLYLYVNLIKNYRTDHSGEIQISKLITQIFRVLASLISTDPIHFPFNPIDFIFALTNLQALYRKSVMILIYIYVSTLSIANSEQIQNILMKLAQYLPLQSKSQYYCYYTIFQKITQKYLSFYNNNDDNSKDQFLINFGNTILNRFFHQIIAQRRNANLYSYFSDSDRVIKKIFAVIELIIKKKAICEALSKRKIQILQKCLFFYNVQSQLSALQITQQMLKTQAQSNNFKDYVICKSQQNRSTVCNIIAKLHQVSSQQHPDFLQKYIMPIVNSINRQIRITSSKTYDVGLKNLGYTCYMNSMLQVLNQIGPFRNSLMRCQSQTPLVKQLQKLFAMLFFSQRMDYVPQHLLSAFHPPINPFIQQDTTQFLNQLFDQLQPILQQTQYKQLLNSLFKGQNTTQMICNTCKQKKQNVEPFFSFGVQIQNKQDLSSALEGTYQGQVISDYLCDFCHQKVDMIKRNLLSKIPNIMFIHLKRFVFNYDQFANMKIHTKLTFPEVLNIQPYTKQGVQLRQKLGFEYIKNLQTNEQQQKKFEQMTTHDKQKDFYKLNLKAIIVHSGSADVGHYYTIVLKQKDKQSTWKKYDDSKVSSFMRGSFQSQCYGGNINCQTWDSVSSVNAYVLVYQKIVKNPIKIITYLENLQQQSLLPYQSVTIYNSPQSYREIWMDNHNNMVQMQLLDSKIGKGFINFIGKIIQQTPSTINKIQMIFAIVFKVCTHSGYVGQLSSILTSNTDQITPQHFFRYVTDDKLTTSKLLFHSEKAIREFASTYIHILLIQAYKKGQQSDRQKIIIYIYELLNTMNNQASKNWMKIDGYLKLLRMIIMSSINIPQLWKLFLQRNMISTLIDFVMQKQSPVKINPKNYSLGTKTNPMDFSQGLSIIKIFLKHSYGFIDKNYQIPSIPSHLLFHLNNDDVICLSYMQFYKKMLREYQNYCDLAFIIQNLCIMNIQFSKSIIQVILQTKYSVIQKKKQEKTGLQVIILQILKIKDDFWVNRAQYMLGIALPRVIDNNLITTSIEQQRYILTSTLPDMSQAQTILAFPYINRRKQMQQSYRLLKAILEGCLTSDISMTFLSRQPSLSYMFSNFIEWIQYFLNHYIKTTGVQKKPSQHLSLGIDNFKQSIQQFKSFIQNHHNINIYKPIITGSIQPSTEQLLQILQQNGIKVAVTEYTTYCAKSAPSFGTNPLILKHLQKEKIPKHVANTSNILKFFKQQQKMQQESENKNKNVIQDKQINLQQVSLCNYFRQIKVTNNSNKKKTAKLIINTDENPNFIVPQQFIWHLSPNTQQIVWLSKQDYEKDWGKFILKLSVQQFQKSKTDKKVTSYKLYDIQPSPNKIQPQNTQQIPQIKQKQQIITNSSNIKQCKLCTYINLPFVKFCEACENQLF